MKYYRVEKENFLWDVGAIIELNKDREGYIPVDEIFKKSEYDRSEYISKGIVENDKDGYFTRVYKVNLATRVVYEVKDEAKKLLQKQYKK